MKHLRDLFNTARYAFWAWLDARIDRRYPRVKVWVNEAAWNAAFAKHADAINAEADYFRAIMRSDTVHDIPSVRAAKHLRERDD